MILFFSSSGISARSVHSLPEQKSGHNRNHYAARRINDFPFNFPLGFNTYRLPNRDYGDKLCAAVGLSNSVSTG